MYPTDQDQRRILILKILTAMSGFLRELDVAEGDILRRMLVRFAMEATGADLGALAVTDNSSAHLRYHVVFCQEGDTVEDRTPANPALPNPFRDTNSPRPLLLLSPETLAGETGITDTLLGRTTASIIRLPLVIDNSLQCMLEIATADRILDNLDLETLVIISNMAAAAMENTQLFRWAISDPLTGLANIHYFRKTLQMELKRAERYKVPFSVAMVDLDNFKPINDTYGHAQGDAVLTRLATVFHEHLRVDVDLPGRYGGDEFVLLLPNTPKEGAFVVMSRILQLFREISFTHRTLGSFSVTLSIGIASFPEQGESSADILAHADQALYQAKKAGRNRIRIYGVD